MSKSLLRNIYDRLVSMNSGSESMPIFSRAFFAEIYGTDSVIPYSGTLILASGQDLSDIFVDDVKMFGYLQITVGQENDFLFGNDGMDIQPSPLVPTFLTSIENTSLFNRRLGFTGFKIII